MRPRVRASLATAILSLALPGSAAPSAPALGSTFELLRSEDLRLAAIGYRLFTANAPLCRAIQPEMGWALQAIDQFDASSRPAARAVFGFETPLAVEAVVPGGPAARAGVVANDSIVLVGGSAFVVSGAGDKAGVTTRNAAEARLAALSPAKPVAIELRRDSRERTVTLTPVPGCRSGIELVVDTGWLADSDGARIRIGSRWLERFSDDEVAVIVAHELAHTILNHRERLDAARVSRGLLAEVGRNGRLFRQTEDDADQLSVSLLYNAGYDPVIAERFWRDKAPAIDGGLFRARTHRTATERAARVAAERATIPAGAPRPHRPPVLTTRDTPLS